MAQNCAKFVVFPGFPLATTQSASMSSPRRRIETDVMKLYTYFIQLHSILSTFIIYSHKHRLMSDYEVNLVNDNMQEFYVRFHGPKDSKRAHLSNAYILQSINQHSTVCRGGLEGSCRDPRSVSLPVTIDRIYQQNLSSKH
jgi:hypothetical protein